MFRSSVIASLGLLALTVMPATAGTVMLTGIGGMANVPVKSLKDLRFRNVVRQQYDFSCGSAALATLLTYHYKHPISEQDAFKAMYETGDKEKIRKEGFSMLDMKRYLDNAGYPANGFRASLDKLAQVGIPAIVLLNMNGYMHFVVVKGVSEKEVLVGDPASGLRSLPRKAFEDGWNGILFVINDAGSMAIARNTFNTRDTWQQRRTAPLGLALSRESLATYSLLLGKHDF
ncbi:C39 family peptidase [Thermithiobacillus plumbiphilus]|uniref:C39 family peptidase n=1 Tax=Thermithiobacillus plumbiphilus TaxID=1729899 RepID=A0ABU9D5V3_9PROT